MMQPGTTTMSPVNGHEIDAELVEVEKRIMELLREATE